MHDKEQIAREAQRAYLRAWRAKNRERVKRYQVEYWARRAAKAAAEREEAKHDDRNG